MATFTATATTTTRTGTAVPATNNTKTKPGSFRVPRPAFLHAKDQKRRLRRQVKEQAQRDREAALALKRRASLTEAETFIEAFVRERWSDHWHQMSIDCPYAMPELKELGLLPQLEGVRACRKLVSVPVIYDEIGFRLWQTLAERNRGPGYVEEDAKKREKLNQQKMAEVFPKEFDAYLGINRLHPVVEEPQKKRLAQASPKGKEKAIDITPSNALQTTTTKPRRKSSRACTFCSFHLSDHEHAELPAELLEATLHATRGRKSLSKELYEEKRPCSNERGSPVWHRGESESAASSLRSRQARPRAFPRALGTVAQFGKRGAHALGEGLADGYGYSGHPGPTRPGWSWL